MKRLVRRIAKEFSEPYLTQQTCIDDNFLIIFPQPSIENCGVQTLLFMIMNILWTFWRLCEAC